MDDEDRKIGMLIAAFHDQSRQLEQTIKALGQAGSQLRNAVRLSAKESVEAALAELRSPIHQAGKALIDLQGLSLWRAAWQHVMVAAVAMAIALIAVRWYVPPLSQITALRTEQAQLEASIQDLQQRGARIQLNTCGPTKRLCVLVDTYSGQFADARAEKVYMIAKGY